MGTERVLRFFMCFLVACVTITSALPGDTIYVDVSNSPGPWDGTAENPYHRIQDGINAAVNSDEVVVAPGTYYEAINFNGKGVRLYSSGGPDVTTIDGNGAYHVVQCVNSEDPNTILDGFTITGGNANGGGADDSGGGMYNDGSSPTVSNCTFSGNSASGGGGMYNKDSNPMVTNCTFSGNSTRNGRGEYTILAGAQR